MEDIYAKLGRKQEQLENLHQEYVNLLSLVARIKNREVDPESVEITGDSWRIVSELVEAV